MKKQTERAKPETVQKSIPQKRAKKDRILVIGAGGQLGRELVRTLVAVYGEERVVASDIREEARGHFPYCQFEPLNVFANQRMERTMEENHIGQVYHLAAILSADGEIDPQSTWQINLDGLLLVLEACRKLGVEKIFWPSSIAVFGPMSRLDPSPQFGVKDAQTVYGIAKSAGELWCQYYHKKYGLDVRCLRYPGIIGHGCLPAGGTTDYAVDIFHHAVQGKPYTCYLSNDTKLPMLYMPDAVKAALDLMNAPTKNIKIRTGYNLQGTSFTPIEVYESIRRFYPRFKISFEPDFRQQIAEGWPRAVDDTEARKDWGWDPKYDLDYMTEDMLDHLARPPKVSLNV
ncbi:NAD-dependent epimerase/dehydratase family protein [Muricauda sp. JGD-17]|uniref:NAD-dependent epimerase/dehydratase family protein n=1 Tax=Flagellimonas ochracea TaxID=2696472 RepID=A0A964WWV9_9FLAO|nr:NAD-dependent epimerase/dehydratase family protein [Allomuricauda ochracea]NAY91420.1 NAD-dependent epimerase/dehydratase family protein [Allomuricauda ochracea]